MNLRVYLSLLLGLVLVCSSCKKGSSDFEFDNSNWDSIDKVRLQEIVETNFLDTVNIKERLALKIPTSPILVNGELKDMPFLYELVVREASENQFFWTVGDLHSQDSEYFIEFTNIFRFKDNSIGAGRVFYIRSNNPNAVTMKRLLEEIGQFAKILYHDEDSMIYLNSDMVRCLSFKYYPNEELYAIYYDDSTFKVIEESYSVKLDFIIDHLKLGKAFLNNEEVAAPIDFSGYVKIANPSITSLYYRLREELGEELSNLKISSDVNPFNYNLLKFDHNVKQFWDELNRRKEGQIFTLNKEALVKSEIPKLEEVTLVYKNDTTLVFKHWSSDMNKETCSYIKKCNIDNELVLLTDREFFSNAYTWKTGGKAMFYLRMLESLPELK